MAKIITVYHGSKSQYGNPVYCKAIYYQLGRHKRLDESILYANQLLESLTNFSDPFLLQMAINDAQTVGSKSPFISTTKSRLVARSFALDSSESGYIYTITGPEDLFYDFNATRAKNGLPPK